MTLLPDWQDILRRAWSVRLIVLAFVLTVAEVAFSVLSPGALGIPAGTFALLSGLASAGAFVARILAQGDDK